MPTRPARSSRRLAGLCAAAAGLSAATAPAADGPAEGFVRTTDRVTRVSSEAGPGCPPGGAPAVHGLPAVHGGVGVPGAGLVAGHLSKLAPHGYITWGEIGRGLMEKPPLIPPLGGYDAYLPPDYGWQAPIAYPVQRVPVRYQRYYPDQWYGLPGSQKAAVAPVAFMPTDTSQLGYYHQQVPTWRPPAPGSFPAPPDPRLLHRRECPQGPDVGVYPGIYPGEPRGGAVGLRDRLRAGGFGPAADVHGPHGGVIVTDPALGAPLDGGMTPVPAAPADPPLAPLPSSTETVPDAPAPTI